jgi:hypothetical protein
VQNNIIAPALAGRTAALKPPLFLRVMARWPSLRRIPARIVGLGVRREHVAEFIRQKGQGR